MSIREKVILEGDDQVTPAARSAEKGIGNLDDTLKKLATAGGLAIAVKKMGDLAVASAKMAIDAGEAASAFATTFGDALPEAAGFVEEFANMAGFADHELQQMLATTGAVVQGIGATEHESAQLSETMARLAGDVASFSNASGGAEAVMLALQSAINGEREALKTYGLAVSEAEVQQRALLNTGKASADELTRLEKAYATVEVATDKAGKMVGDLERTQDSTANSLRSLAATAREAGVEFGESLIPIIDDLIPAVEEAIPAFGRLADAILNAFGQPIDEAAGSTSRFVDGWSAVVNSFTSGVSFLGQAGASGLNWMLDARSNLDAMSDSTDLVTSRFGEYADMLGWTNGIAGQTLEVFNLLTGANVDIDFLDDAQIGTAGLETMQDQAEAMNDLIAVAERMRTGGDVWEGPIGLANGMAHLNREGTLTADTLEELVRMFDLTGFQTAQAAQTMLDAGGTTEEVTGQLQTYVGTVEEQLQRERDAAEAARMASVALQGKSVVLEEAVEEIDSYTAALRGAIEAGDTYQQALLEATDPVFAAIGAFQDYRDTLADVQDDGKTTGDEFIELAESQLELNAALSQVDASSFEGFMTAIQTTTGESREQIQGMLADLGLIDGRTFSATVAVNWTGSGNRGGMQSRHEGGFAPDGEYPTILKRGELVIPTSGSDRESFRDLVSDLSAQMRLANPEQGDRAPAAGPGGGVNINISVYGDDAPTAARTLEASSLLSDLERLARDVTTWEGVG